MSPTLWVYWIGQPRRLDRHRRRGHRAGRRDERRRLVATTPPGCWPRSAAWRMWRRAAAGMGDEPASRDRIRAALRFGAPRAPSALLAQALFWADLWVLAAYASRTDVDTYSAASRLAQVVLLFLTSLNLLFSPFAADLHARGRREQLDALFKSATRWALAATIPVVIVLCVAAPDALRRVRPGLRERRDDAADPARRPAGERGHRQRRLHPDHGRAHRPRPVRQRAGRGRAGRPGRPAGVQPRDGGRGRRRRRWRSAAST